jgi:phage portal protein BeeE
LFNPYQGYPRKLKGISPMAAAAMDMEIDQVSSKWNRQFFKNGASGGQVLKSPDRIDKEAKERAIESWRLNY